MIKSPLSTGRGFFRFEMKSGPPPRWTTAHTLEFLVEVSGVAPLSASEITPASPSAATIEVLVHPLTL